MQGASSRQHDVRDDSSDAHCWMDFIITRTCAANKHSLRAWKERTREHEIVQNVDEIVTSTLCICSKSYLRYAMCAVCS
jgi:hypothetical protein